MHVLHTYKHGLSPHTNPMLDVYARSSAHVSVVCSAQMHAGPCMHVLHAHKHGVSPHGNHVLD